MKKILIIQGGGRPKGNTRQLVDAFAQGAMDAGSVKIYAQKCLQTPAE